MRFCISKKLPGDADTAHKLCLSDRVLWDVKRQRLKTKTSEGVCVSYIYMNESYSLYIL